MTCIYLWVKSSPQWPQIQHKNNWSSHAFVHLTNFHVVRRSNNYDVQDLNFMPIVCPHVQIKDRGFVKAIVISIVKNCTDIVLVSCYQELQGVAIPCAMLKEPDIKIALCQWRLDVIWRDVVVFSRGNESIVWDVYYTWDAIFVGRVHWDATIDAYETCKQNISQKHSCQIDIEQKLASIFQRVFTCTDAYTFPERIGFSLSHNNGYASLIHIILTMWSVNRSLSGR